MHRNVPRIKCLEIIFPFSWNISNPPRLNSIREQRKVPLEAQSSLRALLAAAFPEVPLKPTQPSQSSENQVETRPHVWFLALRWQITLCLSPSESWGQILKPQAFISTKFHLLSHLPAMALRFSSPRRRRSNQGVLGFQRAANSSCWTPWAILSLPAPHHSEMSFGLEPHFPVLPLSLLLAQL